MNKLFPTQEMGSLAKPRWRVKGYRGESLEREEVAEAVNWGQRLGIQNLKELVELLGEAPSAIRKRAILEWSAKYAIRFLEAAGLDIIFDGEQWRSEMYEHILRRTAGFKFLGYVKSFDYRYFKKAACVSKPEYVESFYWRTSTPTLAAFTANKPCVFPAEEVQAFSELVIAKLFHLKRHPELKTMRISNFSQERRSFSERSMPKVSGATSTVSPTIGKQLRVCFWFHDLSPFDLAVFCILGYITFLLHQVELSARACTTSFLGV